MLCMKNSKRRRIDAEKGIPVQYEDRTPFGQRTGFADSPSRPQRLLLRRDSITAVGKILPEKFLEGRTFITQRKNESPDSRLPEILRNIADERPATDRGHALGQIGY